MSIESIGSKRKGTWDQEKGETAVTTPLRKSEDDRLPFSKGKRFPISGGRIGRFGEGTLQTSWGGGTAKGQERDELNSPIMG